MKKKSIIINLIFCSLAMLLAGCNDDVFIKPLEVSPADGSIGPGNKEMSIAVEGESWKVGEVHFFTNNIDILARENDGRWHVSSPFVNICVDRTSKGVDVKFERLVSKENGTLYIQIEDEYDVKFISIDVLPSDEFSIEIVDVRYRLDQWSGYPDEDFDYPDLRVTYPHGLSEATVYTFPEVKKLPVLYCFRSYIDEDYFRYSVLNSHIQVPVPTYSTTGIGWSMKGETAGLTTSRSYYETPFVPPLPPSVELPSGRPLSVGIVTNYECLGVDCTIEAVNPGTGKTESIGCILIMWVPVSLTSQVNFL